MGISRKLPTSDEGRRIALNTALAEHGNVAPADVAITPATFGKLAVSAPGFNNAMQWRATKLGDQTDSTVIAELNKSIGRMFISHYIQVFNKGVDRGVYTASQRTFFGLAMNSDSVPSLSTEAEILNWGEKIRMGDIDRLAAGGAPMSNPTTAEVVQAVKNFRIANDDQTLKKAAYDKAQEAVADMRVDVDKLIKKIWDEVETFYDNGDEPSKRRKSRDWGVVYKSEVTKKVVVTVLDKATGELLNKVDCFVVESDTNYLTNPLGIADIETTVENKITINTTLLGYEDSSTVVTFLPDVLEYEVKIVLTALVVPVPVV